MDSPCISSMERSTFMTLDYIVQLQKQRQVILKLLQSWTDKDFTMEITTSEKYDIPSERLDLTARNHNRWVRVKWEG